LFSLDEFMWIAETLLVEQLEREDIHIAPTDVITAQTIDLDSIELVVFLGALAERLEPSIDFVNLVTSWDHITFADLHHLYATTAMS
jgi:acyl carrier protein